MVTHRAATIDGGLLGRQRGLDRERQLSSAWRSSVAKIGKPGQTGVAGAGGEAVEESGEKLAREESEGPRTLEPSSPQPSRTC